MNFLKDYTYLYKDTEVPDIFTLWGGLCGISCVLGRRLWIDKGVFTVYPNIYVVLVAESGKCRKSTAVNLLESHLRSLSPVPNLLCQKITCEGLIDDIRNVELTDGQAFLRETCEGMILLDELKIFLNNRTYDGGLGSLLIPLWDARDFYRYRTKGRGVEEMRNICVGMFAGTTVRGIREAIPASAIGDGLTSRFIFVYVDKPRPPVPDPTVDKNLKSKVVDQLAQMCLLAGEVKLSEQAKKFWHDWYIGFFEKSPLYYTENLEGYASRRATHLLKTAMLFAVANGSPFLIKEDHIKRADLLLVETELRMPEVMSLITSTESGMLNALVFARIQAAGKDGLTRRRLVGMFSHRVSSAELYPVIQTLIESGKIRAFGTTTAIAYRAL